MTRSFLAVLLALGLAGPVDAATAAPSSRSYFVTISGGTLQLEFHGDRATGCERRGLCDVSGTVVSGAKPAGPAFAVLSLAGGALGGVAFAQTHGVTRATVHSPGTADCTDDAARSIDLFGVFGMPGAPAQVAFGPGPLGSAGGSSWGTSGDGSVFDTRCAGPTAADLAIALPRAYVKRSALARRAPIHVDLRGTRYFTSGGFTGSITSDIRLTLRRAPCGRHARECRRFDHAVVNSD